MLIIEYGDRLLKDLILAEEEQYQLDAIKFVDKYNILDEDTRLKLIEYRMYQNCCLDNLQAGEIFKTTREIYEREFDKTLQLYKNKTNADVGIGFVNIPIERG